MTNNEGYLFKPFIINGRLRLINNFNFSNKLLFFYTTNREYKHKIVTKELDQQKVIGVQVAFLAKHIRG